MSASDRHPKELADAVLELAAAICPHNLDAVQRARVREALTILVDEILAQAARARIGESPS